MKSAVRRRVYLWIQDHHLVVTRPDRSISLRPGEKGPGEDKRPFSGAEPSMALKGEGERSRKVRHRPVQNEATDGRLLVRARAVGPARRIEKRWAALSGTSKISWRVNGRFTWDVAADW